VIALIVIVVVYQPKGITWNILHCKALLKELISW